MKKRILATACLTLTCISFASCADTPEKRLQELDITLAQSNAPVANYVSAVRSGNLIFLAGHLPKRSDGSLVTGKLGRDLATQEGYEAARLTAIALVSTLKSELGDLSKVKRIVKVSGMVNATPDYTEHSKVINGCSDLLVDVFGEQGRHARVACGYVSLPLDAAVEIDLIIEVE
ncbi:RidA family protein [Pelagicoccus sp. NFK12]|uniref:RidA family protein n=1 Tax=Pelagicoccus enzymogenes TaxID=2773457 RepID=A0A927F6J5_9BACT|nr:RidA family protein [Pelagicoccus enzymogenes]MBD5777903.1 RidA family protein [Pelagicoccus enzymogenes]